MISLTIDKKSIPQNRIKKVKEAEKTFKKMMKEIKPFIKERGTVESNSRGEWRLIRYYLKG